MKRLLNILSVCVLIFMFEAQPVVAEVEMIAKNTEDVINDDVYIDTSNLKCDTQPILGNGIYLQVRKNGHNPNDELEYDISVPNKYKETGFSNSPMYVYDEKLNYIKSIEFEDFIGAICFVDGYFYFSKSIYGGEYTNYKYYKSLDGETLTEISDEEHTLAVHKTKLPNGTAYTWKQYEVDDGDMTLVSHDKLEYIIDGAGDMCLIERENNKYTYAKNVVPATDINVYVLIKRNIEDYNDLTKCSIGISLDGISVINVPNNADTDNMWNDKEYLYLGILEDNSNCYRIPLVQLSEKIKVKYKDRYLSFDTPPTTENDRTLVPMRFLFEQMGANVDWENSTQTATVEKENEVIAFSIDNTAASVNNVTKTMDVPARLVNDKTMIPLRFLSEELGYNVEWDEATKTVTIKN